MEITNDVILKKIIHSNPITDSTVWAHSLTMELNETEQREFLLWIKKNKPELFKEVMGEP